MTRISTFLVRGIVVALIGMPTVALAQRTPAPPPISPEVVSDLQVRVLQLEQANQQLTGQLEEMRFQNQQLNKQLDRLQDDVLLRLSRIEQGGAPAGADQNGMAPAAPPMAPSTTGSASPLPSAPSAASSYDPNAPLSAPVARQLDAPRPALSGGGAPAPLVTAPQAGNGGFTLRTDAAGRPLPADPNAPAAPVAQAAPPPLAAPRAAPPPAPVTAGGLASAPVAVALPQGTPKQQYDFAFEFVKRQDYARAEGAMRAFVKQNPKDPLAGSAQFWVGEQLYTRGDYQAAAEEYMNGYKQYPKSNKGPEFLLKLGMAMGQLKQTQGACTALGQIAKEYPDAEDRIRKTAQAERTKLKCT